MKRKFAAFLGMTMLAILSVTTIRAVPVTGNTGFSGSAKSNVPTVQPATEVVSWMENFPVLAKNRHL